MAIKIIQTVCSRDWIPAQRMRMIDDNLKPGVSVSRIVRQNGISPALLYKWRKFMVEGETVAVEVDEQVVSIVAQLFKIRLGEGTIRLQAGRSIQPKLHW